MRTNKKYKITDLKDDKYYVARSYYFDLAYYYAVMDYGAAHYTPTDDESEEFEIKYEDIDDDITENIHLFARDEFFDENGNILTCEEINEDTPIEKLLYVLSENSDYITHLMTSDLFYFQEDVKNVLEEYRKNPKDKFIIKDIPEWITIIMKKIYDKEWLLPEWDKFTAMKEEELENCVLELCGHDVYHWMREKRKLVDSHNHLLKKLNEDF